MKKTINVNNLIATANSTAEAGDAMRVIIKASVKFVELEAAIEACEDYSLNKSVKALIEECGGDIARAEAKLNSAHGYFNRKAIAFEKKYPNTFGWVDDETIYTFLEAFGA